MINYLSEMMQFVSFCAATIVALLFFNGFNAKMQLLVFYKVVPTHGQGVVGNTHKTEKQNYLG